MWQTSRLVLHKTRENHTDSRELAQGQNWEKFKFNFEKYLKQMIPEESIALELLFEWSHFSISPHE